MGILWALPLILGECRQLFHHTLLGKGCRQSTKYGSCGSWADPGVAL